MLNFNGRALVKVVKLRKETHDDQLTKAVSIKLELKAVPLAIVEEAFVSQLSLFYGKGEDPKLPDLAPLSVSRHVSNVRAVIRGLALEPMIVDGVRLTILPNRVIDVILWLKGPIVRGSDELHDALSETVEVELVEREFVAEQQEAA